MSAKTVWKDVSVPIRNGMVSWPGDPKPRVERVQSFEAGDDLNVTRLDLGAHTGTHLDAPLHYLPNTDGIDRMPLNVCVGPARILSIDSTRAITAADLEPHAPSAGERILLRTRNSSLWQRDDFVRDFVHLAPDAAAYLAERRIQLVGTDYLSIGSFHEGGPEVHRTLLGAGVWILEGLDLTEAQPGACELICLPLRVLDADGAPARAIIRQ